MDIKISQCNIGSAHPPFIIAEMSGNHNQSLDRALEIVEAAAKSGAHAIKLQTYTADTMTIDVKSDLFKISDPDSLWSDQYLYDLYKVAHTPWDWHEAIFERAKELGIICFSSPFDETAVDFLEELGAPAYKIASFEANHFPLIKKVAGTGKPVIISTGVSEYDDIIEAVECARSAGCKQLILLKCTSSYPAPPEDCNILTIPDLKQKTQCEIGLSDHTMGLGASLSAIAHGACVIEKHFTLSREEGGVDSAFSLEPDELASLVVESKRAWQSLGKVSYKKTSNEKKSNKFRRSLFFVQDVDINQRITEQDIAIIRPGDGLAPKYYDEIIGLKVRKDVQRGTPVSWKDLDQKK